MFHPLAPPNAVESYLGEKSRGPPPISPPDRANRKYQRSAFTVRCRLLSWDTVFGDFTQLLRLSDTKTTKNMLFCTLQRPVVTWSLGPSKNMFDNLCQPDVHDPFTHTPGNLLRQQTVLRYNNEMYLTIACTWPHNLEPIPVHWNYDQMHNKRGRLKTDEDRHYT